MSKGMPAMFKGLMDLQRKMDAIQKELGDAVFTGEAAGGLVKVTMTGKGEIKSVTFDPDVLKSEDAETVGDLVVVATRKAYEQKEAMAKEKLATVTAGVLPFGLKVPGMA